jgi:hypothetical protein
MIKPMLAYKVDKKPIDWSENVFMQPKLDGVRCVIQLDDNNEVVAHSRTGKQFFNVAHITNSLHYFFTQHPDIILDGELYNHDLRDDFEKIISLVRKQKPTPSDKAEASKLVQFHCYDYIETVMKTKILLTIVLMLVGSHANATSVLVGNGISWTSSIVGNAEANGSPNGGGACAKGGTASDKRACAFADSAGDRPSAADGNLTIVLGVTFDSDGVLSNTYHLKPRWEDLDGKKVGALISDDLSAVPIPAAAWLFGSALVGLVVVARRRDLRTHTRVA